MKNQFYSTGGLGPLVPDLDEPTPANNQNEPYLELFTFLTNLPDEQLPHTLSTSYGEDEQSIPAKFTSKVCDLIGGLGARGMSVIFSSGDTGVGSACQTNDGKNTTRDLPGLVSVRNECRRYRFHRARGCRAILKRRIQRSLPDSSLPDRRCAEVPRYPW